MAGLTMPDFKWIRPVLKTGKGVQWSGVELLDSIRADLESTTNSGFQPENRMIIGSSSPSVLERPAPIETILRLNDAACEEAWILHSDADFVRADYAERSSCETLQLVFPENVYWVIGRGRGGKRKTSARFDNKKYRYEFSVTDYTIEDLLVSYDEGVYPESDVRLIDRIGYDFDGYDAYRIAFTVSLGQAYNEKCYKLIAGVMRVPMRKPETFVEREIVSLLIEFGLEFIDNRLAGGVLWIVESPEALEIIRTLERQGFRFKSAPKGGKATGHRPAWYLEE